MVRVLLDMCVPNLESPASIYAKEGGRRLLLKKGNPLTEKTRELLAQNNIEHLEFPLPFETVDPPPFTFSEETESALFSFVRDTYIAFAKEAVEKPTEVRRQAYDIIARAADEFRYIYRHEQPLSDSPPKRGRGSVVHLRTVGALEDYLFEHAKNVCLTCVVLGFDYFSDSKQLLADLHKVAVAGLFADIGMIKIPSRIIKKDTELSDEDWEKIHKHPEISAQFVEKIFRQKDFVTTRVVLQHHERGQAAGYPGKISLSQMEPHARLLAVVDSYYGMISKRYFRSAHHPFDVIFKLNVQAGTAYERRAVLALNYRVAPYPIGSVARTAGNKLVQILDLTNIPIGFRKTRLFSSGSKNQLYNIPHKVRAFTTKPSTEPLPAVSAADHLDKIGQIVDTYDLLSLYGYVRAE